MEIEFNNGCVYEYFLVPRSVYQALRDAASEGAFFNRHVRAVYPCARVGGGDPARHATVRKM